MSPNSQKFAIASRDSNPMSTFSISCPSMDLAFAWHREQIRLGLSNYPYLLRIQIIMQIFLNSTPMDAGSRIVTT